MSLSFLLEHVMSMSLGPKLARLFSPVRFLLSFMMARSVLQLMPSMYSGCPPEELVLGVRRGVL